MKPAEAYSQPGGQQRIVDDFNKSEIQFLGPEVQLRDEVPSASVMGLCNRSHNGAALKWSLWAESGEVLAQGQSQCASGGFTVKMNGLEGMACGVNYQLVIEGQWGGSAFTGFVRRCQPLAHETLQNLQGLPPGTECELEYVPSGDQSPCSQVCYLNNILISHTAVPAGQCSGLAARLAGP